MKNNPKAKIEKPEYASWEEITVVPEVNDEKIRTPKGGNGEYKIVFSLGLPLNVSSSSLHIGDVSSGDSHLLIKGQLVSSGEEVFNFKIKTDTPDGAIEYTANPNKAGYLSSFECTVGGTNFREVASLGYKHLSPALSHISFINSSPVFVSSVSLIELNTGSSRVFFLSDGKKKTIHVPGSFELIPEISAYLAVYREAQNASTSTYYQMFCFFKIIDGISKNRGSEKQKININKKEVVPEEYIHAGKKFNWVKNYVSKKHRDAFAHFIFNKNILEMNPDNIENLFECILLIPELEYIARTMIENEMSRK